jgi:hypothetical protein
LISNHLSFREGCKIVEQNPATTSKIPIHLLHAVYVSDEEEQEEGAAAERNGTGDEIEQ